MAEKDMAEKKLEDYPEVFTDIVNTLLFSDSSIHLDENKIVDGQKVFTKQKNRIKNNEEIHLSIMILVAVLYFA